MKITRAVNGFVIEYYNKSSDTTTHYVYDTLDELLREIAFHFDGGGSRHDESRLYIIRAPGDKHPDFTDAHAKVIWGENE